MPIEGKVARVLPPYEIAINIGMEEGVGEGDRVTVFRAVEVEDPDTKELLGAVRQEVVNLKVIDVQARLALARVSDLVSVSNALSVFTGASASRERVRRRVTANPAEEDYRTILIAVGDGVIVRPAES